MALELVGTNAPPHPFARIGAPLASPAKWTCAKHISENLCLCSVFCVILLIGEGTGRVGKFVDVHNEWALRVA